MQSWLTATSTPGFKQFSCLSFQIAGTTSMCHRAQLIFVFLVERGFCRVDQAGLKLLAPSDPPVSAFQSAGVIGVNHSACPSHTFYKWQIPDSV